MPLNAKMSIYSKVVLNRDAVPDFGLPDSIMHNS